MKVEVPTTWEMHAEEEWLSPRAVALLVVSVLAVLYAIALLLIARRMLGAFTAELPWQAVLVTATTSFAIISGVRMLWRRASPEPTTVDKWIGWGASLALVLLAGGVSFPRGQSLDWVIWLPALIADHALRRRLCVDRPLKELTVAKRPAAGHEFQQIVRTRDSAGVETVTATLRADFVEGQRHATVYVAFCPPLAGVPRIAVAPVTDAEIKIVQAFAHGARIDVRLARAAPQARSVHLHVDART